MWCRVIDMHAFFVGHLEGVAMIRSGAPRPTRSEVMDSYNAGLLRGVRWGMAEAALRQAIRDLDCITPTPDVLHVVRSVERLLRRKSNKKSRAELNDAIRGWKSYASVHRVRRISETNCDQRSSFMQLKHVSL